MAEPVISEEQVLVVASKFVSGEAPPAKSPPRPTLPLSYGESHLLLLPRDPQTLFAAWDVSASTIASLKERIGGRALAVSTFTLRLVRENGAATVFHLAKKHRSRYLKIDGPSPSFVAEVGFTTPAGRFELIARSAACSVPGGSTPRPDPAAFGRRTVIGYREARSLVRRGLAAPASGARGRVRAQALLTTAAAAAAVAAPRVLGGASDLYRR